MDLRRCFATLRACDFFDLSVFLHTQPDVLNLFHKSRHPERLGLFDFTKKRDGRSPRPPTTALSIDKGPLSWQRPFPFNHSPLCHPERSRGICGSLYRQPISVGGVVLPFVIPERS